MKCFTIVGVIAVLSIVSAVESKSVNIDIDAKEDDLRESYCDFPRYSPFTRECALFKCSKDRKKVLTIQCPYSPCPTKLSYNEEKFSKPYPDCCGPPVCS